MSPTTDPHTINAVQQTLRSLTVALATAARVDFGELSELLAASAKNDALTPEAVVMLDDLAKGVGMLGKAFKGARS
jgi:hypothetical protein